MSTFFSRVYRHRYSLLKDGKQSPDLLSLSNTRSIRSTPCLTFLYLFVFSLLLSMSFFAGRFSFRSEWKSNVDLRVVDQVFRYNRTFGEAPSNITNRAWAELFPEQGGFFKHPTLAPHRSAFSVFHQLHCLDSIRHGFWTTYQASLRGEKITEEELPIMSSPSHIRHCIDLLRHTLMCQPDTTVEAKSVELNGVHGFGTMHQCRDWDQLMRWTGEWEAYDQDPRNTSRSAHNQ